MPAFPKPKFAYQYDPETEIASLRSHRKKRAIPKKDKDHLLVATWNLANFGVQQRRPDDLRLIAEVVKWFDVTALQEVGQNLHDLKELVSLLGSKYTVVYTDTSGNRERMAFVYDTSKLKRRELVCEVAPFPSDLKNIKFDLNPQMFTGFDRNPFLQSFRWKDFDFCLTNVHLYFGSKATKKKEQESIERRQLETFAVARWAKQQTKASHSAEQHIVLLGDFNLPHMTPDDPIFRALTKFGLVPTEHATEIGTTLPGEAKGNTKTIYHYDQIAFVPGIADRYDGETGTFDFDGAIFSDLWAQVEQGTRKQSEFNAFVKYYISDHRPLWVRFGSTEIP